MIRTWGELAAATRGRLIQGDPAQPFTSVSIDTRSIQSGAAFFALRGPRFDAHDFLNQAAEKGASGVVVHRPSVMLPPSLVVLQVTDTQSALQEAARAARGKSSAQVVALTGSNGKTTTKEMLAAILRPVGSTLATQGNLNNHLGLPLTLLALRPEHQFAVLELGTSIPGDMDLLARLSRPQVALITNVGEDHLAQFGSPQGVLKENAKLFDVLPKDGIVILNRDDPWLAPLEQYLEKRLRVISFSSTRTATIRASDIQAANGPVRFLLHVGSQAVAVALPVLGRFQVLNALAAAAAAHALGVAPSKIAAGLAAFQQAAMRMQMHALPDGAVLINDAYNANPSSMRLSVAAFCERFAAQPRWAVLGDMREMGPLARKAHQDLGAWLAQQALDRVYLYGRDTRFIQTGLEGAGKHPPFERFRKKRYLLSALQERLPREKPAVLFKASRSLKLEQVIQPLLAIR